MKVYDRTTCKGLPSGIGEKIKSDIISSLNAVHTQEGSFIVNPSLWYWKNPKGKIAPSVVNSATFISKKFQTALVERGWKKEKTLAGQAIDGYICLPTPSGQHVAEDQFIPFFESYTEALNLPFEDWGIEFHRLHPMFGKRKVFEAQGLPESVQAYLKPSDGALEMRVGLEFETGNIASSFRALIKLENLYQDGLIDAGVFITSNDKASTATVIWPTSNRNGSFEELKARNYNKYLTIPLWEYGFAPDGTSNDAPYLGSDGTTYVPATAGEPLAVGEATYERYEAENREILKLVAGTAPAIVEEEPD
jgi:hypothetical protein